MSALEPAQPDLHLFPENLQEELLSASELTTVLEMLAIVETTEDLDLLQYLTMAQKQQVWDATPVEVKAKVWQIRQSQPQAAPSVEAAKAAAIAPIRADDQSREQVIDPAYEVGDWVVLKAEPGLSKAELIAIFEVMQIADNLVQVKAEGVGLRHYPPDWLLLYLRSPSDF
jgi:hypothetical protein